MVEHKDDKKFPEQIERFINNYNKLHNSNDANKGNVYHIISEDINGNITNECFALNVITNAGMTKYQKDSYLFCHHIYDGASAGGVFLGVGTGVPSITDTTLFENAPYTTPTKDKYANSEYKYDGNWYDISYDSSTRSIIQRILISISEFDYNLPGITEDMTITEIGIGPSITNLYFHALVYDSKGNVSSFVKNINEKLTIYIYSTISIKASIFSDLYNKGVYACFQPGACFHKGSKRYYETNKSPKYSMTGIKPLSGNNDKTAWIHGLRPKYRDTNYYSNKSLFWDSNTTIPRDNVYQSKLICTGSYTITDPLQSIDKMTMHFYRHPLDATDGVWIYPNLGDGVTEEIVSTNVMTNGIYDMGLDFNFGGIIYYNSSSSYSDYKIFHQGHIPVGDINISSLNMFNYKTGEYDIPVNVVDNNFHPEARYNMNKYTVLDQGRDSGDYITPDLTYISGVGFVMVNENTSIPIKRFWCDNDSSVIVKATDTFWDTSSFITIPNKNDVSQELGTKRYYIFNKATNLILRYFDRDQKFPTVLPNEQPKNVSNFGVVSKNLYGHETYLDDNPFISSDNLEYISNGLGIFYPETYDGTDVNSIVSYKFTNIDIRNERTTTYFIDNTSNGDVIIRVSKNADYSKSYFHFIQVGDSSTTPITYKYEYPETQAFVPCISLSREYGILALQNMTNRLTQTTTAYIVKIYDDEGNFNPSTITLTDVQHCRVIYGTTKYVYVDLTNGENIQINIADALTNTIEDTFTIDSIKYTKIDGILGWKKHIYICAYDSEYTKYVTIYYNIDTKTTEVLDNLNTHYVFSTSISDHYVSYTGYGCSYIDECICINPQYTENSDDRTLIRNLIITDSNPTSPIPISYASYYDNYNYCYHNNSTFPNYILNTIQVKKVNNGKNIILMKMNAYYSQGRGAGDCRVVVNDIGPIIYNNTQIKDHSHRQLSDLGGNNYSGKGTSIAFGTGSRCCLYKDSVHQIYEDRWSSSPFEAWELMKMVGTTTTIQSYNNPKNIGYDNFPVTVEVTNNPELWS